MNAQSPKNKWVIWLVVFCLAASFALAAPGEPVPPNEDLSVIATSHRLEIGPISIPALAGNVSELNINTTMVTNGWQGYYGDVSGTITLDDALNNSMYSWAITDPSGEVYASRNNGDGIIDWSTTTGSIVCAQLPQLEAEEAALSFNWGGVGSDDGINETFSFTTHPAFVVGGFSFAANDCTYTLSTYVDDTVDPERAFNETILYDGDDALIFAAIIHEGGNEGFMVGADDYDFQMLVPEDGHEGDLATTEYYFWVEIE